MVVYIDPGLVTGWCSLSIHEGEVRLFNCGETDHLGIGNLLFDNLALKAAVENQGIETIFVVERFIMNSKVSQQPYSLETIGLIRYFANLHHIPFNMVSPSEHKKLITNNVIKRAGLWTPSPDGDQMDAVRLCLWYTITKKNLLTHLLSKG